MKYRHKNPLSGSYEKLLEITKIILDNMSLYQSQLGVTAAEKTQLELYYSVGTKALQWAADATAFKESVVRYNHDFFLGPISEIDMPVNTGFANSTVMSKAAGLKKYLQTFIKRVKSHANYTADLGERLGIVGAENVLEEYHDQPKLREFILTPEGVRGGCYLFGHDGYNVYKRVVGHEGGFEFFRHFAKAEFLDDSPLPGYVQEWEYQIIYVDGDHEVGIPSDITRVNVKQATA
ncbi:MAG: hypothetical protein LBK60_02280 [Verrucomicrobiales bacterium]|jgi:hypothetical protein|nr:hypothetical protein [Verrucomicrobiales bacterium]